MSWHTYGTSARTTHSPTPQSPLSCDLLRRGLGQACHSIRAFANVTIPSLPHHRRCSNACRSLLSSNVPASRSDLSYARHDFCVAAMQCTVVESVRIDWTIGPHCSHGRRCCQISAGRGGRVAALESYVLGLCPSYYLFRQVGWPGLGCANNVSACLSACLSKLSSSSTTTEQLAIFTGPHIVK